MTNLRLFWHLIKFHLITVPRLQWVCLAGMVIFMGGLFSMIGGATRLDSGDNLFSLIYFFILAAQVSWGMQTRAAMTSGQTWATGAHDFLRTRAVDKSVLFWSKLVVFLAICSLVWVTLSVPKLIRGEPVKVTLYDGPQDRRFENEVMHTSSLEARVLSKDTKGRTTIELGKGAGVIAGLTAAKVALISLLTLCFFVAFRWPPRWLLAAFFVFLGAWLLTSFGSLWLKGSWLEWADNRGQVLFYARHPLAIWLPLLIFGGLVIWRARRRYIRP